MVYGIIGMINFAHGEVYMIGSYVSFMTVSYTHLDVYKRQQALQGVTFHMQPGEMAFLTGHSGAGKSTLLKLILSLIHILSSWGDGWGYLPGVGSG